MARLDNVLRQLREAQREGQSKLEELKSAMSTIEALVPQ